MQHLKIRRYLGRGGGGRRILINLNDSDSVTYTMSLSFYKLICIDN